MDVIKEYTRYINARILLDLVKRNKWHISMYHFKRLNKIIEKKQ